MSDTELDGLREEIAETEALLAAAAADKDWHEVIGYAAGLVELTATLAVYESFDDV